MAELSPKERLQPSLLDRLTDDEPDKAEESRERRVLSMTQLRQSVLRDVGWLLNTRSLESVRTLADYTETAASVLNYGIRDLSGVTVKGLDPGFLELEMREALRRFEPRILPDSLRVRVLVEEGRMNNAALVFAIEGELWAQPLPLHLYIRSEVDLETGDVKLGAVHGAAATPVL